MFDGLFLACEDFWENVRQFIPRLRFFFLFFFKVEISSCTLISLFRPGLVHSDSASWDDCGRIFPKELHLSPFPGPLCLDSGIASPLRLRWVKDECAFNCKLPRALLAEWLVSFMYHCGNTGVERTANKKQHTKLTLEKKILPPLLPGFELATFWSWVRRSYQQAIPAPNKLPRVHYEYNTVFERF